MILFRCDANASLGMGHLMRCRTLAGALADRGQRCVMVGPDHSFRNSADDSIFCEWVAMAFKAPPAADAAALVGLMAARSADVAIVDDYRVDEAYQLVLRDAGVRWLQFSDGPRMPLWADFALNPSPEAGATPYQDVIRSPETKLLLGPRFAMLRREFTSPATPLPPPTAKRVLLTFGGGDDRGAILTALQTLVPALPKEVQFVVIAGAHNPRNAEITAWIEAHGAGRARLHIDPANVAPLIAGCSVAVMAGGGTTYEANFCGLSMLLVAIAENQVSHSRAWQRAGAAIYLGRLEELEPVALLTSVQKVLEAQVKGIPAIDTKRLVDGHGRTRVADAVLERVAA